MEHLSRAALVMLVCWACACGKKEEPARPAPLLPMPVEKPTPSTNTPTSFKKPDGFDQWPAEKQQRYRKFMTDFAARVAETAEEDAFSARLKQADEREMVRPAPPGFKPEPVARKTRLTLIAKKTTLKPGETFWYRLELQNLGQDTLLFHARPSFWKIGNAESDRWSFYVTPPGGQEDYVGVHYYDFDGIGSGARGQMNAAQREDAAFRSARNGSLNVDLRPGQTLVSRAWRLMTLEEFNDSYYRGIKPAPTQGEFRELALLAKKTFAKPGTYRIRVDFQAYVPKPPTEKEIQESMQGEGYSRQEAEEIEMRYYKSVLKDRLGRFESNTVTIEVKP